jgi:hypothetical protein
MVARNARRQACARIDYALQQLAMEAREPDQWEADELETAIAALFRGAYPLATAAAEKAMVPKTKRTKSSPSSSLGKYSRSTLEEAFEQARVEPIREFPHLGPIVFA